MLHAPSRKIGDAILQKFEQLVTHRSMKESRLGSKISYNAWELLGYEL